MRFLAYFGCFFALAALAACGDPAEEAGGPTGSVCSPGSTLTYETFAQDFMEAYCTRCHSSALSGNDRHGAPSDHNFDTLEGIRDTETEHIDEEAAAGPNHVNTAMPPDGAKPSEAARRQLGEWLACGMP